ncbi:uncharacterized protein [Rutidosis leptorrhynchoides]|uniref:uncharacterized protein n=1 Tax=Rutidosis leptorrhynchoides TaxID=125765 RepID=UPI003A9A6661
MADDSYDHVINHGPLPPTTKKSNKIRDIVRLQQMLKKWKKAAATSTNKNSDNAVVSVPTVTNNNNNNNNNNKPISTKGLNKFLKKTLSFSDISSNNSHEEVVRKGYLAVCVGREEDEMKKFVIPTDYLAHQAFSVLLRDAEEEFGFQQEGILKIPCDVPLFENILKMMTDNKKQHQRPTLKSSSSTSSFFLYDDQDDDHQQKPQIQILKSPPLSPPSPHYHHQQHRLNSTFDSQLKTPPTTPAHHLPLYCR